MKRLLKVAGRLVMVSRPLLWAPVVCLYAFGVQLGGGVFTSPYVWAGLLFFTFPANSIAYGLNDIADRASDAMNGRKGHVYGVVLNDQEVRLTAGLAAGFAAAFTGFFAVAGRFGTALAIGSVCLLCALYSFPPVRLKARPGLDALSNGVIIALIFLSGYYTPVAGVPYDAPAPFLLALLVCTGAAMHIFPAVLDYEVDKRAGDRTIAVAVGRRGALAIAAVLIGACFWLVRDYSTLAATYMALNFLILLVLIVHPSPRWLHRAMAVMLAMLLVCAAAVVFN